MPSAAPDAPQNLVASVVLHRSDLVRFRETLLSLDAAVARAGVGPVHTTVVDQTLDAAYARRVSDVLHDMEFQSLHVDLLVHGENRGYGAGHNVAWFQTPGRYALVLNPDVQLAADALKAGLDALESAPDAVLAAPVSRTDDGRREYLAKDYPSVRALVLRALGWRWLQRWNAKELARYEMRHLDDMDAPSPIVLASGACMLIRGQALQAVAGFDEAYFLYFEDYDLSRRLAAQGSLLQVPNMQIVHHGGGAARKGGQHIRWFVEGGVRFFRRWGWRWW